MKWDMLFYRYSWLMKKQLSCLSIALCGMVATCSATFSLIPHYGDERFPPTDAFHAWCENELSLIATPLDQTLRNAFIRIEYDAEDIEILSVRDNSLIAQDATIEIGNNAIQYTTSLRENQTNSKVELFRIQFRNKPGSEEVRFMIKKDSNYTTNKQTYTQQISSKSLYSFASVPECTPDITPPQINLISPSDNHLDVSRDSPIILEISDDGKGINTEQTTVTIHDTNYTVDHPRVTYDNRYMTIYPDPKRPASTEIAIDTTTEDLQRYWWANKRTNSFTFTTQAEPQTCRELWCTTLQPTKLTHNECQLMKSIHSSLRNDAQQAFDTIQHKVGCAETYENNEERMSDNVREETLHRAASNTRDDTMQQTTKTRTSIHLSTVGMIGWTLFLLTFILKLHYLRQHKQQKKKNKQSQ